MRTETVDEAIDRIWLYRSRKSIECINRLKSWGYLNDREFGLKRIKQLQGR